MVHDGNQKQRKFLLNWRLLSTLKVNGNFYAKDFLEFKGIFFNKFLEFEKTVTTVSNCFVYIICLKRKDLFLSKENIYSQNASSTQKTITELRW